MMKWIITLAPILATDPDPITAGTVISSITSTAGTLISSVLGWLTSFTTWIVSDPLALIGFIVAFIMLGVHLLHSLVKFSW